MKKDASSSWGYRQWIRRASVVSILVEDLFAELVSAKKLSSVGVKDRYLPSLEGLISRKHKIREKFTPQILDDTPQVGAPTVTEKFHYTLLGIIAARTFCHC